MTDRLSEALSSFRCCLDEDIESFLREKAVTFLKREWCSVYLVLDAEKFDAGQVEAEAYFTLSHKSIIPLGASKAKAKAAAGWKEPASIHFVLIGQLGKRMERTEGGQLKCADISAGEILDYAFEVIRDSSRLIPCRCALVECSENPKLHRVYRDYGFVDFQQDGGHYQFIKRI